MAKDMPYQAGYDHGCSDAKLMFSAKYINQPGKGPQFHTQEFMSRYNAGFSACSNESSPVASNVADNSGIKLMNLKLYYGYNRWSKY